MHGRAEHEAVRVLRKVEKLVHAVVDGAATHLPAQPAGDAAGHGANADPEDFAVDFIFPKRIGDDGQRAVGAAVLMGAAVYKNYLHKTSLLCLHHSTFARFRQARDFLRRCMIFFG